MDAAVRLAVLEVLARRGADHEYERPVILEYSLAEIDFAVAELHLGGYVQARSIPQHSGGDPEHWAPSVLTAKGRHLLKRITR